MKTEKEKMLSGELYDPLDQELSIERRKARLLIKALNDTREDEVNERITILKHLIPNAGEGLWLQPPFFCDYGSNIKVGEKVFFNFNCVVLDVNESYNREQDLIWAQRSNLYSYASYEC